MTPPALAAMQGHTGDVKCLATIVVRCDFILTDSSDPTSTLQESPTRFPPTRPKSKSKDPPAREEDSKGETGMKTKQKCF